MTPLLPFVLCVQSVLVVEPGGAWPDIQAAVDAAADGDTLLVRPGEWSTFVLDGKGLVVLADGPGPVVLEGTDLVAPVVIRNVPASSRVILRGLELNGSSGSPFGGFGYGLELYDCTGDVFVEACRVVSELSSTSGGVGGGVFVTRSDAVHVVDCWIEANDAGALGAGLESIAALEVVASRVSVHGSTLLGSDGAGGGCPFSGECGEVVRPAGPGARVSGGRLALAGCLLVGGDGGDGVLPGECLFTSLGGAGGDGGPALELGSDGPQVTVLDSVLVPGAPGTGADACPDGMPSAALSVESGAADFLVGTAGALSVPSPVRTGTTATLDHVGGAGEQVLLVLSSEPEWVFVGGIAGVLAVEFATGAALDLGLSDPLGAVGLPLAPSFTGTARTVFLQAYAIDANLAVVASSPTAVTLLGPGF